jgi:hypothetical protein
MQNELFNFFFYKGPVIFDAAFGSCCSVWFIGTDSSSSLSVPSATTGIYRDY